MYTIDVAVIANGIIDSIKEYRKARNEESTGQPIFSSKEGFEKHINDLADYFKRNKSMYSGRKVNLTRCEYWESILRAKAEVIVGIGGSTLLREVCEVLSNHPENPQYNFAAAFEVAADGLAQFYG